MNTTRLTFKPSLVMRLTLFAALVFLGLVLYLQGKWPSDGSRPLIVPYPSKQYFEKFQVESGDDIGRSERNSKNDAPTATFHTFPAMPSPTLPPPSTPSMFVEIPSSGQISLMERPWDEELKNDAPTATFPAKTPPHSKLMDDPSTNLFDDFEPYNEANLGRDLTEYCGLRNSRVGDFIVCPMFLPSLHSQRAASTADLSITSLRTMFKTSYNDIIEESKFTENKSLIPIAFVTQCSFNRLHRVASILERWQGPVSAAVFVENVTVLKEVIKWYNEHVEKKNGFVLEHLDIHIVMDDPKKRNVSEYPINFLRNVAMDLTLPPWILVADADAMPSSDASYFIQELRKGILYNQLAGMDLESSIKRTTYLVPAFEMTVHYNLSEAETPSTKEEAVDLYQRRMILPMHNYFRPAYMPTDYGRWARVTDPYHVPYQLYFEPYYIARTTSEYPPRYDDRFTNYGKNKAQQNYELQAMGYTMTVLPNVFVIDMGHPEGSNWRREFNSGKMFSLMNQFRIETDIKHASPRWHDRSGDFLTWFIASAFHS